MSQKPQNGVNGGARIPNKKGVRHRPRLEVRKWGLSAHAQ